MRLAAAEEQDPCPEEPEELDGVIDLLPRDTHALDIAETGRPRRPGPVS